MDHGRISKTETNIWWYSPHPHPKKSLFWGSRGLKYISTRIWWMSWFDFYMEFLHGTQMQSWLMCIQCFGAQSWHFELLNDVSEVLVEHQRQKWVQYEILFFRNLTDFQHTNFNRILCGSDKMIHYADLKVAFRAAHLKMFTRPTFSM